MFFRFDDAVSNSGENGELLSLQMTSFHGKMVNQSVQSVQSVTITVQMYGNGN